MATSKSVFHQQNHWACHQNKKKTAQSVDYYFVEYPTIHNATCAIWFRKRSDGRQKDIERLRHWRQQRQSWRSFAEMTRSWRVQSSSQRCCDHGTRVQQTVSVSETTSEDCYESCRRHPTTHTPFHWSGDATLTTCHTMRLYPYYENCYFQFYEYSHSC